jgi:hypothetical protein
MTRSVPFTFAFALASLPAVALADVTVEFSAGVDQALGGDPGASQQETRLQDAINGGLNGLGSGRTRIRRDETPEGTTADGLREIARKLSASNQKIQILCREEARERGKTDPVMKFLYEQSEVSPNGAGGAATHGDFDEAGNPKQGGTMIVVIECARLLHGWFRPIVRDGDTTMLHVLGHELVHAVDADHVHDDDMTEDPYYDAFGDLFQRVTLAAFNRQKREKAKEERKPAEPAPPCEGQ